MHACMHACMCVCLRKSVQACIHASSACCLALWLCVGAPPSRTFVRRHTYSSTHGCVVCGCAHAYMQASMRAQKCAWVRMPILSSFSVAIASDSGKPSELNGVMAVTSCHSCTTACARCVHACTRAHKCVHNASQRAPSSRTSLPCILRLPGRPAGRTLRLTLE